VRLTPEPFSDTRVDEVIQFVRDANPFSQHNWGWDTGRFVDWRWSGNAVREAASPGWFSRAAVVFRDGTAIRALAIREYGDAAACIITPEEDPPAVRRALEWLIKDGARLGTGLTFEISNRAQWLRNIFSEAGMVEKPDTGREWEYDLSKIPNASPVPDGFSIEGLGPNRVDDYAGIAACVGAAFKIERDLTPVLVSIERNPFFRPELSVFARSPDGRVAAYCRGTVDPANGVCGIDPICTHPGYQKLGLGKAVVETCFRRQRALAGRFSYIGSAPEPAPGTFLYRALGPSNVQVFCEWSFPEE
jgi:hypothetical protein